MQIDRRSFLTGAAASFAAVAAVAIPAPRYPFPGVRFAAIRVSEDMEEGLGHWAVRRFTALSCWYFDPATYPGYPLVRHHHSGLTFMIEEAADSDIYARQIFLPTDPADLTNERRLLTGVAARRVAIRYWPEYRNWRIPRYMLVNDLDMTRWRGSCRDPAAAPALTFDA